MILVDTSAWIEFLRASSHPVHLTLRHHLTQQLPIVTTEIVIMELLAGTRSRCEYKDFDEIARCTRLRTEPFVP